jgi:fermentation-respiration switch protein FrsA (DUF1100 family)
VKRLVSAVCHVAVLVLAFRWACSTSGFLVIGLGLCLLLDRYVLRLLPWSGSICWTRELSVRAGYFLIGATAFFWMRPGIVPVEEAAYRGVIVSLVAFLGEQFVGLLSASAWMAWCLRGCLVCLLGLSVPLIAALHPLHTVPKRSPAAMGLAFANVRFRTSDGLELAGWVIPADRARGNVIFCHGHGRNRGHVAALLPTLHELGLNVLAFDFRGHGDSEGHTSTFGHREVADLMAAVAYLNEQYVEQPLILVGISLGADVLLQALPQLPQVQGVWSEGAFSRFANVADNQFAWVPACFRGELMQMYYRLGWLECGMWGPAISPIDRLSGLSVPIYFCHAQGDQLVPAAEGEDLYAAYRGPKWHWWVENATHYNVRQRNNAEYLRRLKTFVENCLSAQNSPVQHY